ncbi:hypothetical protein F2Q69_00003029 [Brassica cretica]|uniref:Uncharacterized protein n=1 Tax=Brassica cretica TaxID=69181 RepID=A0A8S9NZM4_BRACR|nr:hypothetical protein F2Q69_00003029 [Brassica cretica]
MMMVVREMKVVMMKIMETQKRTMKIIVRIMKLTEKNLDVMRMKRRGSGNECG